MLDNTENTLKLLSLLKNWIRIIVNALTNGDNTVFEQAYGENKDLLSDVYMSLDKRAVEGCESVFAELINDLLLATDDVFTVSAEIILEDAERLLNVIDGVEEYYKANSRQCIVCKSKVLYKPISPYYEYLSELHDSEKHIAETLNSSLYECPCCGCSDRDRLICVRLSEILGGTSKRVLQIAPAPSIEYFIKTNFPNTEYMSTDLFMDGVSFKSDIQDMNMVEDDYFDVVICSHVLEHVENDRKAMSELKRIIKPGGEVLFLVPIAIDIDYIDEEWGLSEEENWKRFGQGDHCRLYGKLPLMKRLLEAGLELESYTKESIPEDVFYNTGLSDHATLYLLRKQ